MGHHHGHGRRDFFRICFGSVLAGATIFEEAFLRAGWARAQAQTATGNLFTIEKVADGAFAALAKPQALTNSNAAIFVLDRDVLVVDAHSKPSAAAARTSAGSAAARAAQSARTPRPAASAGPAARSARRGRRPAPRPAARTPGRPPRAPARRAPRSAGTRPRATLPPAAPPRAASARRSPSPPRPPAPRPPAPGAGCRGDTGSARLLGVGALVRSGAECYHWQHQMLPAATSDR